MCFIDDDIGGQHFTPVHVKKARRHHKCEDCSTGVLPGEPYTRYSGKAEGEVYACVECVRCKQLRQLIYEREIAEGCSPNESLCPLGLLNDYVTSRKLVYDPAANELREASPM